MVSQQEISVPDGELKHDLMAQEKAGYSFVYVKALLGHWHAKGELDGEPKDDLIGEPCLQMHGEPEGEQ